MPHSHQEKHLNPEQEMAVHFGTGPLLIIAGAGTGKTTVITERIKHLITSGLATPQEILALTFTEKAAREMEDRVDHAMPYGYIQMWISTFHSFCDRILKSEAIQIGLNPGYRLLSDADATQLLRTHLFKMQLDYFRPLGNPNKFIKGMLQHFSRLQDEDVTPGQYLEWVKSQKNNPSFTSPLSKGRKGGVASEEELLEMKKYTELANAYQYYEDLKIKEGKMDFGDLITHTLSLFRTRKNILARYQQQFKFILVDEFQDTNIAQNELVVLLSGEKRNITAVCDDDQSIYKFRGAAVSNVLSFRKHFPKSELIVLSKNYRSSQTILDQSYDLIQHNNPDRLEVKEKINKKLVSMRKLEGEAIEFLKADRVENEADAVAKVIKRLISVIPSEVEGSFHHTNLNELRDSSTPLRSAQNDNYSWKDVAILIRANAHAEPFVRSLTRHGIPYQFLGPGQLFRQPEIKELISYLQLLDNYEDSVACFRVLSMEHFAISGRDLATVSNFAKKNRISLFESSEIIVGERASEETTVPKLDSFSQETLQTFVKMVHRHLDLLSKESAGQILYFFLEDTGMMKKILDYKTGLDERRANNITKFFGKLKSYEVDHDDASVKAVLDWILLSMELGESPLAADSDWADNDAVNILTVHSAKGLEFPVVFLVNLVSQRFPSMERREQIPIPDALIKEELPEGDFHEQEERRLFYVGMTRACDLLYFTAANFYGEGKREKKISPFVYEALGNDPRITNISEQGTQLLLLDWKKAELQRGPEVLLTEGSNHKTKINYLSYSQIETFRTCPLHYKLRYLLKVPTPPSAAQSFGVSVHAALKSFYEKLSRRESVTKELLLSLLDQHWVREGYTSREYEQEMKARGIRYLTTYFESECDPDTKVLALEKDFRVSIGKNRFLKIGGKIDRVDDKGKGKIEIIDYKTGRALTQREADVDLQLSMYAIAATHIPEPPFQRPVDQVMLTLHFFDAKLTVTTTRTKEQLEAEKARILEIADQIEQSHFICSDNQLCQNCEFKLFCGNQ